MTRVVIDIMFVCHFIDPNMGVDILFKKEETTEKGVLILKQRIGAPLNTCIRFKENFMQGLLAFFLFLITKKNNIKFWKHFWLAISVFDYPILLIYLVIVQSHNIRIKYFVDMSRSMPKAGGGWNLFCLGEKRLTWGVVGVLWPPKQVFSQLLLIVIFAGSYFGHCEYYIFITI